MLKWLLVSFVPDWGMQGNLLMLLWSPLLHVAWTVLPHWFSVFLKGTVSVFKGDILWEKNTLKMCFLIIRPCTVPQHSKQRQKRSVSQLVERFPCQECYVLTSTQWGIRSWSGLGPNMQHGWIVPLSPGITMCSEWFGMGGWGGGLPAHATTDSKKLVIDRWREE